MKRRWNLLIYAGSLLSLVAFLSYFIFFARYPLTRDFPWVNLVFFSLALALVGVGLARAYRRPEEYRGKVSGPILATLSLAVLGLFLFYNFWFSRQLPAARGAPVVGEKAPDFTLPDTNGTLITLSTLWASPEQSGVSKDQWVLLVFYRGYW